MKRIKRLIVPNGTYQKDGQEKTSWLTIGSMLKADDGRIKLKLDSLPVGEFDGWVTVVDIEDQPQQAAPAPSGGSGMKVDEDLPF